MVPLAGRDGLHRVQVRTLTLTLTLTLTRTLTLTLSLTRYLNLTKGTSRETLQRGADFARWLADNDVRVILLDRNNKLARRVSAFKSSRAQEHAVIDAP